MQNKKIKKKKLRKYFEMFKFLRKENRKRSDYSKKKKKRHRKKLKDKRKQKI